MPKHDPAIEVEGLATDYAAGTWIEPHNHDAHQILHAAAGVFRVISEDAVWVVPPGRAIWMPADRVHAVRCHTATAMRTVYLDRTARGLPSDCAVWSISPLMREVLIRMATVPDDPNWSHLLALLLAEIAEIDALPLALPQPQDPRLRGMTETILTEPADPRPLKAWSKELGFSERNLIRKFAEETGMTFREWRRQARLLAALERLAAGEPVTSAAFAVGYDNVSAFIEAFRDVFGTTPRRYFKSQEVSPLPATAAPRQG